MPRSAATVQEERFERVKDKVRRLEGQLSDARVEAGRIALAATRQGVTRSRLASIWCTNMGQIDVMLQRARSREKGGE